MEGLSAGPSRFWKGRGVLVTGATGLLGSWLVKELLSLKARVVCLVLDADPLSELVRGGDLRRCAVVEGRLESFRDLERAVASHEPDAVIHLGAQAIVETARRSPLATFEANIRGTYNLLEACRRHPGLVKRVVVSTSDKAYGAQKSLPYREDMPLLGREPYEASKSCADLLTLGYAAAYGLPAAVIRCGNLYGGGDLQWSRIVPGTIRSLLRGERPVVRSDGRYRRDYLYVRDAAKAFLRAAERLPGVRGEAFNIGPRKPMTVLQMVSAVAKAMGVKDPRPVIQDRARGEIRDQYLDSSKARRALGWKPETPLDEGLREAVAWYRAAEGEGLL